MIDLEDQFVENMHTILESLLFLDNHDKLTIRSNVIVESGSHKCGVALICPMSKCQGSATQQEQCKNDLNDADNVGQPDKKELMKPTELP